jgi:hypothetical protein
MELKTITKLKPFSYSGSISTGTRITFGKGFTVEVSKDDYVKLLNEFIDKTVPIGASRTSPQENSLGFWIMKNVNKTAVASYVAPILIHEGYAVLTNDKRLNFPRR